MPTARNRKSVDHWYYNSCKRQYDSLIAVQRRVVLSSTNVDTTNIVIVIDNGNSTYRIWRGRGKYPAPFHDK
jgi:hypothetical protein